MKKLTMGLTGLWLSFLSVSSAGAASPDPRDSVIIESKLLLSGVGAPYTTLRVWITNKDTLGNISLPLVERSISGGGYMTLSWPRTYAGVVNPLTTTLQGSKIFAGNRYDGNSPDSFTVAGVYDPFDLGTAEPPNLSRKALWDIQFDTVRFASGEIEFDSARIVTQSVEFVDLGSATIPVNFVKGTVVVSPYTAAAYGTPKVGDLPLWVFFTGLSSTTVDEWHWSFGDGESAVMPGDQNPIHQYQDTGTYSVTATAVKDAESVTVSLPDYIRVKSFSINFSGTPVVGEPPLAVNFTDLSTGAPTSWLWFFGDGGTSNLQNPSHTYQDTGWYDVTLIASDSEQTDSTRILHYIHVAAPVPDLEMALRHNSGARPGFDKRYYFMSVRNIGLGAPSGSQVRFELPPQASYVSSSPPGTLVGDTVNWTTGPLAAGADSILFTVQAHISEDAVVGTFIQTKAAVEPAFGELFLNNNEDTFDDILISSWDPNDLLVDPVGCRAERAIKGNKRLSYTVLFENKAQATAEAIYVLIVDTLDADLDWGTLQLGPTSHDSVMSFNFDPFTGEMTWFFDSLNLPPNVSPPEGEGYVSYSVSPKAGLSEGTIISSRAHIRFDYNPWLAAPESGPLDLVVRPQAAAKGDMDASGDLSPADVVQMLNCVYLGAGICELCFADVNCSGDLSSADVVLELNNVYLANPFPCI